MRLFNICTIYLLVFVAPLHGIAQISSKQTQMAQASVKELSSLGKVWGLLKYHHPAVANGTLDWDAELLKILPVYLQAADKKTRNQVILKMVKDLGPIAAPVKPDSVISNLKEKPDFAWIKNSGFSSELSSLLQGISHNHIAGKQKYLNPYTMDGMTISLITNELSYTELPELTQAHKLIAVFRYWNIIEYWYPYKYMTAEKWETYLEKFVAEALASKDDLSYLQMVQKMVATIRDSHAYAASRKSQTIVGLRVLPFTVKFIGDEAVVNSLDTVVYKLGNIKRGDVLKAINGVAVDKLLDHHRPYISASNEAVVKREVAKLLTRSPDSLVRVSIASEDVLTKELTLKTAPITASFGAKKYDFPHQRDTTYFIKDKILYINMGKFMDNHAKAVIPLIKELKGIVIDGRQYPPRGGGSISMLLDGELMDQKRDFVIFSTVVEGYPGYFKYSEPMQSGTDNPNYFKGLVTLLVNEETQSTGEFMAMAMKVVPNMKVVGSTTAGADGNVTQAFLLPGGVSTVFTSLGVYYPDKGQAQQVGIVPDVKVNQTLEGFRAGRDEMLEKAVSLIEQFKKVN